MPSDIATREPWYLRSGGCNFIKRWNPLSQGTSGPLKRENWIPRMSPACFEPVAGFFLVDNFRVKEKDI